MNGSLQPEVEALLAQIDELGLPPMHTLTPSEAREMRKATAHLATGEPEAVGTVEDRVLEGPRGALPVRVYTPVDGAGEGTLVYAHGGGWVMGDLNTHDALCRGLTNATGLRLMSVQYRLAPEHPYPAALEDCWAATQWVAAHEDGPIVVGGDSAGGQMATCVSARASATDIDIAAQLLIYPVTDLSSFATQSYETFATGYWLTSQAMEWFRVHYLPPGVDRHDPDVSPLLRADLTGMPPAVVVAAGCDVLLDEGAAYARRLEEAGVDVVYRRYEGVIHGFMSLPGVLPQGRRGIREAGAAVRAALGRSGQTQ